MKSRSRSNSHQKILLKNYTITTKPSDEFTPLFTNVLRGGSGVFEVLSKAIEEIEPKFSANLTQSARILKRMEECCFSKQLAMLGLRLETGLISTI
ncbi:hypothetical protein A4S05_22050 [Nostoc sp. KVJ20]|nr:hypothetical protein A4S05_22050 [Nostoc sp. KVJ20]